MSNFIPNESITINEKDPPWMCTSIKNLISLKNSLFRDYLRNWKSDTDLNRVEAVRKDLIDAINLNKKEHYDRLNSKLRNPKTSSKAYWSILKSLYCDRKSPVIPPLLINNNFVTKFKTKAELFNFFFFKVMFSSSKFNHFALFRWKYYT